jgi:hypothetical protein
MYVTGDVPHVTVDRDEPVRTDASLEAGLWRDRRSALQRITERRSK